jgi:hypothetical protein
MMGKGHTCVMKRGRRWVNWIAYVKSRAACNGKSFEGKNERERKNENAREIKRRKEK